MWSASSYWPPKGRWKCTDSLQRPSDRGYAYHKCCKYSHFLPWRPVACRCLEPWGRPPGAQCPPCLALACTMAGLGLRLCFCTRGRSSHCLPREPRQPDKSPQAASHCIFAHRSGPPKRLSGRCNSPVEPDRSRCSARACIHRNIRSYWRRVCKSSEEQSRPQGLHGCRTGYSFAPMCREWDPGYRLPSTPGQKTLCIPNTGCCWMHPAQGLS